MQQLRRETNVARFGIEIEYAKALEFFEQAFDFIPVSPAQVGDFLAPVSEHFDSKIGRSIDVCLGKVENARREDNCHFNDLFGIIAVDEDRDGEALNIDDRELLESQVRVSFTKVRVSAFESFDCGLLTGFPNCSVISVSKEPRQRTATLLSAGGRNSHQSIRTLDICSKALYQMAIHLKFAAG